MTLRQSTDYTCGPACIRRWLQQFSKQLPSEESLAYELNTTREIGTTPDNIIQWFEHNGFVVTTDQYPQPSDIILVQEENYGHWLFVESINPLTVWNPWTGDIEVDPLLDHIALVDNTWFDNLCIRINI